MGKAFRKEPERTPTKKELQTMYVDRQLSFDQIASELGSTISVVKRLLRENQIPLRKHDEWGKIAWNNASPARREKSAQTGSSNLRKLHKLLTKNERVERAVQAAAASQERRGPTSIERKMIDALTTRGISYVYQFPVGGKFLCDFAFPERMLIVECDGIHWHSRPEIARKDRSKDKYLQKCGYTVMRFTDKQINHNVYECVQQIADYLSAA
jgi:very-short-patch-repair endonuclease